MPQANPKPVALRPVDHAILSCKRLMSALERARGDNYPPSTTAHLWSAVHEHTQVKYHIDRQLQAEGAAWARQNKDQPVREHTGVDHPLEPSVAAFYGVAGGVVPPKVAEERAPEVIAAPASEADEFEKLYALDEENFPDASEAPASDCELPTV